MASLDVGPHSNAAGDCLIVVIEATGLYIALHSDTAFYCLIVIHGTATGRAIRVAGFHVAPDLEATNGGLIVVHHAAGFDAASHSDATGG